jgi:uncharacterized protein (TIGR00730 family)
MSEQDHNYEPLRLFHSAEEEFRQHAKDAQEGSAAYQLAFADQSFLLRKELRPIRLQLELLKADMIQQEHHIFSTVVIFGSARIPSLVQAQAEVLQAQAEVNLDPENPQLQQRYKKKQCIAAKSHYYEEARRLGHLISSNCQDEEIRHFVVVTGGGPGIMEAANRGAFDAGAKSIGLNIVLPHEQGPNPYITPELTFQFHYFAIRKMHFLIRARALIAFPGGFGTLDELFEALTLMQTRKIEPMPVLLFGEEFWRNVINFDYLVEEGMIDPEDKNLFRYVETAEQAWRYISEFYEV